MGKSTIEITDGGFEQEVLKSDQLVVVDFWAQWCGPCLQIGPMIEELAENYQGKAKIGKMDVDANSQVPMQFGIRSIPTILLFKNGQVVDKIVGAVPKATLDQKIKQNLTTTV
jgi:thioredoxin 1